MHPRCHIFLQVASYYIIVAIYSNMVCSKPTKQTASHVAIATYMQPVKLCRIILHNSIPWTVNAVPFPVKEDSIIFKHELICETILDNHHMIPFYFCLFENLHNYTKYLTTLWSTGVATNSVYWPSSVPCRKLCYQVCFQDLNKV